MPQQHTPTICDIVTTSTENTRDDEHTGRNLVVFADGTGRDGGAALNSNIYKMFSLAEDRTARQLCYYHPGVGTGRILKLLGLASGVGFGRNVRACYAFLNEEYRAGDRIFLFGFSRGGATVRSLAYFIHLFGILPRSRHSLVERAWRIYTIRDAKTRRSEAARFIERNPTMWANVHYIGCYDTVAALGAPYQWASTLIDYVPGLKHRFHDMRLSPCVVHAYHALALDDERHTFHPLLWDPLKNEAQGQVNGAALEPLACRTLRQVWFLGMHSDVGGGYPDTHLSDTPLVWLTDSAVTHGFRVYPKYRLEILEDPDGTMHDSRAGIWRFYRKARRACNSTTAGTPVVHESVRRRRKDRTNVRDGYVNWLDAFEPEVEPWHRYTPGRWTGTPPQLNEY